MLFILFILGNRVIVKRTKDKNGREIIEEIKIGKDGKKESKTNFNNYIYVKDIIFKL